MKQKTTKPKTYIPTCLHAYRSQKGLTLIELLIGMAIFSFLGVTIITLQVLLIQSQEFTIQSIFTLDNANASLRTLITELRSASVAQNGAFPLEEAQDQQIIFYSNVDDDDEVERLRYFLDGTDFKKGTINPEGFPVTYPQANESLRTVAEHIQNGSDPIFTYYNSDWPSDQTNNPLSTPAPLDQVTLVKINIRVNTDPSHPERELTLEPAVQIRSLNQNL